MKYIIANWKMNMSLKKMAEWIGNFKPVTKEDVKVIIAPSQIHIPLIFDFAKKANIEIASQDISVFDQGAHTGETGAFQVKEFCKYSIIGHSERNENVETVKTKAEKCLSAGIIPIICFTNPENVALLYVNGALMAWEDPNNISKEGIFNEKDPQDVIEGIKTIRNYVPTEAVVIYGGSINRENIDKINQIKGIDGVLVGSASLDPQHFTDIISAY